MRVLYLMHVDWNWPRQRPHIFAEQLSAAGHDVHVRYWLDYKMRGPRAGQVGELRPLANVPFRRFAALGALTRALQRLQVGRLLRRHYDVVWVTHPEVAAALPTALGCTLVYDCMDLAAGFAPSQEAADRLARMEADLLARADVILTPSETLRGHILRHGRDAALVRNALAAEKMLPMLPDPVGGPVDPVRVLYVGSVSPWFDFETCLALLDARPNVRITLVGPAEVSIPHHDRLHAVGSMPLERVRTEAQHHDATIMPFVLSELTVVMDAIKIYEYVSMRRPALIVRYPELDHFGALIRTYGDLDELLALVDQVAAGRSDQLMAPRDEAAEFLAASDWDHRFEQVLAALAPVWLAADGP
jgi:hypothetical protein